MKFATALILAMLILCSSARAADPWKPFRDVLFPQRVAPAPSPVIPPEPPPPPAIMAPEPEPAPVVVPLPQPRDPKPPAAKPKPRRQPMSLQPSLPDPDYISCAEARRGVHMSCFEIMLGSGTYNGYSDKKKANAQSCLTATERARIKACFE